MNLVGKKRNNNCQMHSCLLLEQIIFLDPYPNWRKKLLPFQYLPAFFLALIKNIEHSDEESGVLGNRSGILPLGEGREVGDKTHSTGEPLIKVKFQNRN